MKAYKVEMFDGRAIKIIANSLTELHKIVSRLFKNAYCIDDYKNCKEIEICQENQNTTFTARSRV